MLELVKGRFPDVMGQVNEAISKLGLDIKGKLSITKDPVTIDALKNMPKPAIRNITNYKDSKHPPLDVKMDRVEVNQTLLLQLNDDTSDLTIMPIHFQAHAYGKIRKGYPSVLGWTEEVKVEYGGVDFDFGGC